MQQQWWGWTEASTCTVEQEGFCRRAQALASTHPLAPLFYPSQVGAEAHSIWGLLLRSARRSSQAQQQCQLAAADEAAAGQLQADASAAAEQAELDKRSMVLFHAAVQVRVHDY